MERRLAAIMAADVVGYSRLIRADEEGTLAALKALRADLIDPKLAEHNGRIVKLMGDCMLAEVVSVVDQLLYGFQEGRGSRDRTPERTQVRKVGRGLGKESEVGASARSPQSPGQDPDRDLPHVSIRVLGSIRGQTQGGQMATGSGAGNLRTAEEHGKVTGLDQGITVHGHWGGALGRRSGWPIRHTEDKLPL